MTNISTQKTNSRDYQVIHKELIKLVVKSNKKTAPYFIEELLTETERIMLIKRFGAIFMFTQGFRPYRVSQTLGMSGPTAYRLYEQYQDGCYSNLLAGLTKKEQSGFLQMLNDLIIAQASPKARARLMNSANAR